MNHEEKLDLILNKLDSIEKHIELLDFKIDRNSKKIEDLQLDVKIMERDMIRDIHSLKDQTETIIEFLKMNDLVSN
ncbi:MAG: hypothetical protein IJO85_04695 [Lachnospiraceae bacterium]|nr:hypothetical protein [Lachnospiraceae bacterium]